MRIKYPGFEGDQFEDHLHSEDGGEDHVQDVHHVVKCLRLAVVLCVEKDRTGRDVKSDLWIGHAATHITGLLSEMIQTMWTFPK